MSNNITGFCIHCGLHIDSFDGLTECPHCGTKDTPCRDMDQVTISINWHELRTLAIWAERWAHLKLGGAGMVYSIAERLQKQYPDKAPVTLAGEIEDLKKDFPGLETNIPGVE